MKFLLTLIISFFFSLANLAQPDVIKSDSVLIDEQVNNGYNFHEAGNFDSAEIYYLKALESILAANNRSGTYDELKAVINANLGAVYRVRNNYREAIDRLNIAEKYFVNNDPNSSYLGYIYNTKANIYYNFSDFKEAELYYNYCLDFFRKNNFTESLEYSQVYINIFNILVEQNRNQEAIEFLKSFEIVGNKKLVFQRHMFLAEAFSKLKKYSKALDETTAARKIYDNYLAPNYALLMIYNYRVAAINTELRKYNIARYYLLKNIKLYEDDKTQYFEKLYQTYYLLGNIHYLQGNYGGCIEWLDAVINNLEDSDLHQSNPAQNILSERTYNRKIIDFYRLYGSASFNLFEITKDTKHIYKSLDMYSKSIEYLKVFRLHMRNEESVHIESNTSIDIIHEAVNVAIQVYKLTNDSEYLDIAFRYAENMKAFSLFSEINSGEAIQFSDLPQHVRDKEANLTGLLVQTREDIFTEKLKEKPDEKTIDSLNSEYILVKDNYNSLLDSLEQYYPKYFKLRYEPNFILPNQVQDLIKYNECLVEYVLSDSILTTFVIDKKNIQVLNQPVDSTFSQLCFDYFSLLQNQDFSKNVRETYKNYTHLAYKFYDILVAPVLELTDSREITFVPDGAIMYLPFESFVTSEDFDRTRPNYRDLPYLIYDVSVGYSYSSTLLFSERIRTEPPNKKVLAFAPEYKNLLDEELQSIWNRQSDRDFLMPLPGAKEEVLNIANTVATDVYLDTAASEENFKALASDYSVLHLAMHTIMDDKSPMNSRLAFTRNFNDSTEDHNLYTYEIYNLPLNADMVVLSSCSSGYGQMQKGEGMMSMARGFIYAGCPSIVMTLWQVSDLSSAELMTGFYKYLKKGYSKKKALHQAKIDYIQSSDNLKANPYFWSAFLMVGDNSPLYATSGTTYLVIILVVFTLLVIGVIYRKQIRIALMRKK